MIIPEDLWFFVTEDFDDFDNILDYLQFKIIREHLGLSKIWIIIILDDLQLF